jgi:hypothetical protein
MAGSVTGSGISTTILSHYKLSAKSKIWKCTGDTLQRTRRADSSRVRLQSRLPLTGKIQRSVVSKHPESHDPTNCVASENPCIAIFVLNSLRIPRFRPSGRCIHARLPNVLNCVKRTAHPRPHNGWHGLNCTPEGSRKQTKIAGAPSPNDRQAQPRAASAGISPRNVPF